METVAASSISSAFVPKAKPSIAHVELDGEAVLYDEETGAAHVLSPTATVVWSCCDGSGSVRELSADIAEVFGAEAAVVQDDVLHVIQEFGSLGLLEGVGPDTGEQGHDHHDH